MTDANAGEFAFRCKTSEGFMLKVLIELVHNNIKTGCVELHKEGMHFSMTDANKRTLINFELPALGFDTYYVQGDVLKIGLNMNHFYKMLKSIKKKDSVVLFIRVDEPHELGIQIAPRDQLRLTTSYVRVQNIHNLEILLPGPYARTTVVSSTEFAKMCKDMLNMSNTVRITATAVNVRFHCNLGAVYSRDVVLGEIDVQRDKEIVFEEEFDTEQLSRVLKMSGLAPILTISCAESLPMMLQCKIGRLGTLSIYMKSRAQTEEGGMEGVMPPPLGEPTATC